MSKPRLRRVSKMGTSKVTKGNMLLATRAVKMSCRCFRFKRAMA